MSKVKCTNCNKIMDWDDVESGAENYVPYGDTYVIELVSNICPNCGAEDEIEECTHIPCTRCEELFDVDKLYDIDDLEADTFICDDCLNKE